MTRQGRCTGVLMTKTAAPATGNEKKKAITKAMRAGLNMPPTRYNKKLKEKGVANAIGAPASIYITAVLEYVAAELMEQAYDRALHAKPTPRKRVTPKDISKVLRSDEELARLFNGCAVLVGDKVRDITTTILSKHDLKMREIKREEARQARRVLKLQAAQA